MAKRQPKSKADLLDELEQQIGAELPADYRAFMLEFDGALPEDRHFQVIGPEDRYWDRLDVLWPLRGRACSVAGGWGLLEGREGHLLIVGDDGGSNWICLAVRGPQRGKVFFLDHDYEPGEKQRLVKLAGSFRAFMSGLTAYQE